MDSAREQQPAFSPPPSPDLAAEAPAPAQPVVPPSQLYIASRLARLLVRRALLLAERGWQIALPRLGWLLLTGLLTGVIGVLTLLLVLPRFLQPPADTRVAHIQQSDAVVDFLRGQQTYDADLMWEALSPELRDSLETQAITRDSLAQQVESERQAGHRYRSFEYVGGITLDGRQHMYFYAVDVESPAPERNGIFSFVFTVDQNGKIIGLRM